MATGVTCESLNSDFDFSTNFQHVISYLEKQKELMDAHMVDFFISAYWETLLPRKIREDLELLSPQQLASLPTACNHESGEITDSFGENLKHFLVEATKAQLKSFPWLREGREFSSDRKVNFISHIMTPKKSHEVEVMSDVVNSLATQFLVSKFDQKSSSEILGQIVRPKTKIKPDGKKFDEQKYEKNILAPGDKLVTHQFQTAERILAPDWAEMFHSISNILA